MRRWLARRWRALDVDDVIQEAYCRLAGRVEVDHIENPAAYFHRTVHSVAVDMLRQASRNNFASMTQTDVTNVVDIEPLTDRTVEADQELRRVNDLLSQLSDTARQAIQLSRVEGLSRKETASRLGVSETDVKNHLVRGLQKVLKTMAEQDAQADAAEKDERRTEIIG